MQHIRRTAGGGGGRVEAGEPHMILATDAFDRIQYPFMIKALRKLAIEGTSST